MSATPTYDDLSGTWTRLHRLSHLQSIAGWDQASNMPPKGNEARAAAMAEMAALLHRMRTEPKLKDQLSRAEQEPLDDGQRANLREMRRQWRASNALPESLVTRQQMANSRCEHAWRTQRPANDWAGFVENFREVLACGREEARLLSEQTGLSKYDAMMDRFEPGMTSAHVDRVFGDVRQWLPGLIRDVTAKQARDAVIEPVGPFPTAQQRALCEKVIGILGFDFQAGRLDVSTHPFCGGVPEDVRMTTRFNENEFLISLMGTVHETGHGRYEQNLPRDWLGQPVAEARSMALHESQSLSFEMQLGSHRGFVDRLAPLVAGAFGDQPALAPHNLHRLLTRVKRGLIRVDADEVTYSLHIILRFELEQQLVDGTLALEDLPEAWNARMRDFLGIEVPDDARGVLQDVHWTRAAYGYFPTYALGNVISLQIWRHVERELPDLEAQMERGEFAPLYDWLRERLYRHGRKFTPLETLERAIGEDRIDPQPYIGYLRAKVAELRH